MKAKEIESQFTATYFDEDDNEFVVYFNVTEEELPCKENPTGWPAEIEVVEMTKNGKRDEVYFEDFSKEDRADIEDACWDRLRWGF